MNFKQLVKSNQNIIRLFDNQEYTKVESLFITITKTTPPSRVPFETKIIFIKTLIHFKKYEDAIEKMVSFFEANSKSAQLWQLKGIAHAALDQHIDAIESFSQAISLNNNKALSFFERGKSYSAINKLHEAINDFNDAILINSNNSDYYYQRGNTYFKALDLPKALNDFMKSIEINPKDYKIHAQMGFALLKLKLFSFAENAFARVLKIDPNISYIMSNLITCRHYSCNWNHYEEDKKYLIHLVTEKNIPENPFSFLNITSNAEHQKICTENFSKLNYPKKNSFKHSPRNNKKIKIAYLSNDYYSHATMILCNSLFKSHNRDIFDVIGISTNSATNDVITEKIRQDFDSYLEVDSLTDKEVAEKIYDMQVDILVDLKGFTEGTRTNILSYKPAPIQVNYLGFPGSMGADLVDYIIADQVLVPDELRISYGEKVVRIPGSYQINDSNRPIPFCTDSRNDHGLPEDGFVFCCFNNNYKITPYLFQLWMKLLNQVPGSVLWLMLDNQEAANNMKLEAHKFGIEDNRLIFAERLPIAKHLPRHQHADLFLDTSPINAHTTTSDALWSGLPVLTCPGESFASRVAASLVTAAGLPDLVVSDMVGYELMALKIATNPDLLTHLKQRLQGNRTSCDLFNTEKTTRNLELAYLAMFERYKKGLPLDHIDIYN